MGEAVGELTTKKVDLQLATNLRSTILFYRECREMLGAAAAEHRNALVVNMASIAGRGRAPRGVGGKGGGARGARRRGGVVVRGGEGGANQNLRRGEEKGPRGG